ncbi:MAG: hypothetical protein U0836_02430 [Pirellulales bacterium]
MARTRTRKSDNGAAPPPAPAAEALKAPKLPRAATLDEVLEQVRKIAAAEREARNLQGSLKSLRDGLQGLVDRLSSEDQEIYRSILSVEPAKGAERAPAEVEQFDSASLDVS